MERFLREAKKLDEEAQEFDRLVKKVTPYPMYSKSHVALSKAIARELARRGKTTAEVKTARKFIEALPYNEQGLNSEADIPRMYLPALDLHEMNNTALLDEIARITRTFHSAAMAAGLKTSIINNPAAQIITQVDLAKAFIQREDKRFLIQTIKHGRITSRDKLRLLGHLALEN